MYWNTDALADPTEDIKNYTELLISEYEGAALELEELEDHINAQKAHRFKAAAPRKSELAAAWMREIISHIGVNSAEDLASIIDGAGGAGPFESFWADPLNCPLDLRARILDGILCLERAWTTQGATGETVAECLGDWERAYLESAEKHEPALNRALLKTKAVQAVNDLPDGAVCVLCGLDVSKLARIAAAMTGRYWDAELSPQIENGTLDEPAYLRIFRK